MRKEGPTTVSEHVAYSGDVLCYRTSSSSRCCSYSDLE